MENTKNYIIQLLSLDKGHLISAIDADDLLFLNNNNNDALNDKIAFQYNSFLYTIWIEDNGTKINIDKKRIKKYDLENVIKCTEKLLKYDQSFRIYNKVEAEQLLTLGKEIIEYQNLFKNLDDKKQDAKNKIIEKLTLMMSEYTKDQVKEAEDGMKRFFDTKYLNIINH